MVTHTLTIGTDEKAAINLAPKTATEQPAQLDANPVFTVAPEGVVSLSLDFYNKLFCLLTAQAVGTCVLTITATSEGVDVSEQINVTVESRQAVTLGMTSAVTKK